VAWERVSYHCYPEMDGPVVQEPMREGALGTHHVGVFLRRHALLVFLGYGRAIDLVLEIAVRGSLAVRWRSVFVGLGYYGCSFALLCFPPSSEFF